MKNVLIIDDDEINNLICKRMIHEYDSGIEVASVTSGSQGLELIQDLLNGDSQNLPGVILLDINMPLMNGWEFIEEYRKLNSEMLSKTNVFMLSSSQMYQDLKIGEKYSEIKDMFTKPLTFNTLDKIESCQQ